MKIKYCPIPAATYEKWHNLLWFDPDPLLNDLIKSRGKQLYFKCPAYTDYHQNTFIIRSPLDLTITTELNHETKEKFVKIKEYDQDFFDKYIYIRECNYDTPTLLTFNLQYLFYSEDEECRLELLHPSDHKSDFSNKVSVIPGAFDIAKWYRPVECAFSIPEHETTISIKRGDPLYYVRIVTDKKVKLDKGEYTPEVSEMVESMVQIKKYTQDNTMEENYDLAKNYLDSKKSKCPFSRLFKGKLWHK